MSKNRILTIQNAIRDLPQPITEKLTLLINWLKDQGSVLVAFSGGVDSTLLITLAKQVLGKNAMAVTAHSPIMPKSELKEAKHLAKIIGIRHTVIATNEMSDDRFIKNSSKRCYYCKMELFTKLKKIAEVKKIKKVLEASNLDDESDFRPGLLAVKKLRVESPLRKFKITKNEIRTISKKLNLPTADKPAMACMASRIPYGEKITYKKLSIIEKGEDFLKKNGFSSCRLRLHNNIARIEIMPSDFNNFLSKRTLFIKFFKKIGITYITLDIEGLRSGSMNEALKQNK